MSDLVAKQLAEIDIALAAASGEPTQAKPAPRTKSTAPKVKSSPTFTPDAFGDDDDDAFSEDSVRAQASSPRPTVPTPANPTPTPVQPLRLSDVKLNAFGFPDLESDSELIRLRANLARLQEQLKEATAVAEASSAALGLKPGAHNQGRLDRMAAELLAAGKPLTDVDEYEARWKLVRRLTEAVEIASKPIPQARDVAMRRFTPAAQEVLYSTFRDMQLARVAFVRAVHAHKLKLEGLRNSGLGAGNEYGFTVLHIPEYWDGIRSEFTALVKAGVLKADEVVNLPGIRPEQPMG